MPLTDAKLRAAKAREKPYKLFDGNGLFVQVAASGARLWRFRYWRGGKEKLLALGEYPRVSLVEARRRRDEALGVLERGGDPGDQRRAEKAAAAGVGVMTFETAAREWHEVRQDEWVAKYALQVMVRLEQDVFPRLGARPIAEITAPEILQVLKGVEGRGVLETTRRLRQYISSVFRYAIAAGYCAADPASPLSGALRTPGRAAHHQALPREELGTFLRRLDAYGDRRTALALWLIVLTAVRTGELRGAKWVEFEQLNSPGEALWRIPADRMKMRTPHLVPLSQPSRCPGSGAAGA